MRERPVTNPAPTPAVFINAQNAITGLRGRDLLSNPCSVAAHGWLRRPIEQRLPRPNGGIPHDRRLIIIMKSAVERAAMRREHDRRQQRPDPDLTESHGSPPSRR